MTMPRERSFYVDAYSDEVVPCDCSLEGWAQWLAKPDPAWGRGAAAVDNARFQASVLRWDADVVATCGEDGEWQLSGDPEGADLIAVRFGPGLGWDCDSIVCDKAGLLEFLRDSGADPGTVEHVAIGRAEPAVVLIFKADPPRCLVEATLQ